MMNEVVMKKRVVIKLGGASLGAVAHAGAVWGLASLIEDYRSKGFEAVIVHGGGPAINERLTELGIVWSFVNGQRKTTHEMIAVIDDVLANQVNRSIVAGLREAGISAVGLSGASDGILLCSQADVELGWVGQVDRVETRAIEVVAAFLGAPVPVVAPIGTDAEGQRYNVNADWAASRIAVALGAEELVFLTDQDGILGHDKQVLRSISDDEARALMATGAISGGMCTKVLAMLAASESGVGKVKVLNARSVALDPSATEIGTTISSQNDSQGREGDSWIRHLAHGTTDKRDSASSAS